MPSTLTPVESIKTHWVLRNSRTYMRRRAGDSFAPVSHEAAALMQNSLDRGMRSAEGSAVLVIDGDCGDGMDRLLDAMMSRIERDLK